MLKVGGQPLLHYVISRIKEMRINDVTLLVGYGQEHLREHFRDGSDYGLEFEYIDVNEHLPQGSRVGLASALGVMERFINEPFLTMLGDELYLGSNHAEMKLSFEKERPQAMIGVIGGASEADIKKNYTLRINEEGFVQEVEEKPDKPWNDILGCGTYLFQPTVFQHIRNTPVSPRSGKTELTDTLNIISHESGSLGAFFLSGKYININNSADLTRAEELAE